MIKIDEEFSIGPNKIHGWEVYHTVPATGLKAKKQFVVKTSYHPNIEQCLGQIISIKSERCESLEELISYLKSTKDWVSEKTAEISENCRDLVIENEGLKRKLLDCEAD